MPESKVGWLCPACGSPMFLARQLKGYPKTGDGSERRTCALHGPLGQFRHIATDRRAAASRTVQQPLEELESRSEHGGA